MPEPMIYTFIAFFISAVGMLLAPAIFLESVSSASHIQTFFLFDSTKDHISSHCGIRRLF
jgi:hypothetical protein